MRCDSSVLSLLRLEIRLRLWSWSSNPAGEGSSVSRLASAFLCNLEARGVFQTLLLLGRGQQDCSWALRGAVLPAGRAPGVPKGSWNTRLFNHSNLLASGIPSIYKEIPNIFTFRRSSSILEG